MPRIPTQGIRNPIQVSNPTGFQNPRDARQQGEVVQELGDKIARTGEIFGQFQKAREAADERTATELARQEAISRVLKVKDMAAKQAKPDRSDQLEIFNKLFDEETEASLQGVSNSRIKSQMKLSAGAVRASALDDVYKEAHQESTAALYRDQDKLQAVRLTNMLADPMKGGDEAFASAERSINENPLLYSGKDKGAALERYQRQIFTAGKEALINTGRFKETAAYVKKYSKYANPEELIKLPEEISRARVTYVSQQETMNAYAEKNAAEALDLVRTKNGVQARLEYMGAKSPAEQEKIKAKWSEATERGELPLAVFDTLASDAPKPFTPSSEALADLALEASQTDDPVKLSNITKKALKINAPAEDIESLAVIVNDKLSQRQGGNSAFAIQRKTPGYQDEKKVSKSFLNGMFPIPKGGNTSRSSTMVQLRTRVEALALQYESKGMRPIEAMQKAARKINPGVETLPVIPLKIPNANQNTLEGLGRYEMALNSMAKNLKTDAEKKNWIEMRNTLESRKRAVKMEKELKAAQRSVEPVAAGGSTSAE